MESEQISLLSSETEKNKPEDTFLSFFSLFQQELSQEHDQRIPIVIRLVPLEISVLFSFTIVCFAA